MGCADIARACQGLGHRVEVLTSLACGNLRRSRPADDLSVHAVFEPVYFYEDPVIAYRSTDSGWMRRRCAAFGGAIIPNMLTLYLHLVRRQPDVVWVFNPLGLGTVGLLEVCALTAKRCLIHLMDDIDGVVADHQQFQNFLGRFQRVKAQISAISCTEHVRAKNSGVGLYRSNRVIFNGVRFPVDIRPVAGRKAAGERLRVIYFGQVERHKGLIQLVMGASRLQTLYPDLRFQIDIVGGGSPFFKQELTELITKAGLTNKVHLLGFMEKPRLHESLSNYDVAVFLLDKNEPFAFAPFEAVTAGLPIVVTPIPAFQELGMNDYPLLVQNRDDADEVAARLRFANDNRSRMPQLGQSLRQILRSSLDFDGVVLPRYFDEIRNCPVRRQPVPPIHQIVAPYQTYSSYAHVVA